MRGVLFLASSSPRRRDLLEAAEIPFRLHPPGPEPSGDGDPRTLAESRAAAKAEGAPVPGEPGWILGVDTVVGLGPEEFGKPVDRADAARMLRALRGAVHEVHTGHCLVEGVVEPGASRRSFVRCATSVVRCGEFSELELENYLDSEDWADKAGAYGIQGLGGEFMALVSGERDTVIGLNLASVRELLEEVS